MAKYKPQQFIKTAKLQRQPFIQMVKTDEAIAVLGLGSGDGFMLISLTVMGNGHYIMTLHRSLEK